jgi:FkbM family methyltransferase
LGIHKKAEELCLMVDRILPSLCDVYKVYGFEASTEYFDYAKQNLCAKDSIKLINAALCKTAPEGGKIKLYKQPGKGLGSSVYKDAFDKYEEVPALRFSNWVENLGLELENNICLLRMNIEGSEFDVIADIVESGLADHIDGYFGMWDDLSKIDKKTDDEFRAFLKSNRIYPFTFNGRDLRFKSRVHCIQYDIGTAVQVAVKKLKCLEAKSVDGVTS